MNKISAYLKQIRVDTKSVLSKPHETFTRILSSGEVKASRLDILFIVLLHTYYIFIPSYLIMINILAILFFFILVGFMYYFMQECLIIYRENNAQDIDDDRFLYTIGYCFALANIPAFILNIVNNLVSIVLADNLLVGIFWAVLINIPIAIVAFVYPIKLLKCITSRDYNVTTYFEIGMRSFITTCRQALGLQAMRDIAIDWQEAKNL
jgi:hypothetical protein